MSLFVHVFVILALFLSVCSWWNHCNCIFLGNCGQKFVRIVSFITNGILKLIRFNQCWCLGHIMSLTASEDEV